MTVAFVYAQVLRQCLEDELDARPFPAPAQTCLRGGEQTRPTLSTQTDECCDGLAWVRIMGAEPRFDDTDTALHRCFASLTRTRLEMGVARCMPTPGPDEIVTCDQWSEIVARMESDHSAMLAALCCLIDLAPDQLGDPDIFRGSYTPLGPEGRCITGTLELTIEHGCSCGTDG